MLAQNQNRNPVWFGSVCIGVEEAIFTTKLKKLLKLSSFLFSFHDSVNVSPFSVRDIIYPNKKDRTYFSFTILQKDTTIPLLLNYIENNIGFYNVIAIFLCAFVNFNVIFAILQFVFIAKEL